MSEQNKIAVIKYGGHAMDISELQEAFAQDLHDLQSQGWSFVIVHGGGPHIGQLLGRLNVESSFVDGLRVTNDETLAIAEMVLCGQVNKEVVRLLERGSIQAIGLSGEDGGLLLAKEKDPRLGRVGEIIQVKPDLILYLLAGKYLPVIAPLALDKDYLPLNVNADTAAGAIAGALKAACFILISDVPGVLNGEGKLLATLDSAAIETLRANNIITGGMIPKVQACLSAIAKGCDKAIILDGRQKNSLKRFLNGAEALGTVICQ